MHRLAKLLPAFLLVSACGEGASTAITDSGAGVGTAALPSGNGAAQPADAILFQLHPRANDAARTDGGGFSDPQGVAVGNGHLYVVDRDNSRVLGWADATALANGKPADLVLFQDDLFTRQPLQAWAPPGMSDWTDVTYGFVPQWITVDSAGRVYVLGRDNDQGYPWVVVFDDPFTGDRIADYYLQGFDPSGIGSLSALRAITNQRVIVFVDGAAMYYAEGSATPMAQGAFTAPCTSPGPTDVVESTDGIFVACSNVTLPALPCLTATAACTQIYAFERDPATGFVNPNNTVAQVAIAMEYNDVTPTAYTGPVRLGIVSNRLLVLDQSQHRILRWNAINAHAIDLHDGSVPAAWMIHTAAGTNNAEGSAIYGQDGITVSDVTADNGDPTVVDDGFSTPVDFAIQTPSNLLFVADAGNNRVLRFPDAGQTTPTRTANLVLGQSNATLLNHYNRLDAGSVVYLTSMAIDDQSRRFFAVDRDTHRVLVYEGVDTFQTGADPLGALGQPNALQYLPNEATPATVPTAGAPTAGNLTRPTHVAVDQTTGFVYVVDSGNYRILVFKNLRSGAVSRTANGVIGASNLTTLGTDLATGTGSPTGEAFCFGAIAVRNNRLFVAAGRDSSGDCGSSGQTAQLNSVFIWDVSAFNTGTQSIVSCPKVLGQNPGEDPVGDPVQCAETLNNDANRGSGGPRPDGFEDITGLAVDADGRLWVADGGNSRVLWFDNPTDTNLVAATTADGVVGQPDFVSEADSTSAYKFGGNWFDVEVDSAGRLFVLSNSDNRVIVFPTPREPDETGMAKAAFVFGQGDFSSDDENAGGAYVNAAGLDEPEGLAIDTDGSVVLIADTENFRALRFIDNAGPRISGGGVFEVEEGGSIQVTLTVNDPDNDTLGTMTLVPPAPTTATVSGAGSSWTLSYSATDVHAGDTVYLRLTISDTGPRPQYATTTVRIDVVQEGRAGLSPSPRSGDSTAPVIAEASCRCGSSAAPGVWMLLAGLAFLVRRRRW